MMPATLEAADAALARWRERLAAASRNVSELSELPEYARARDAAKRDSAGRMAREAAALVATMDELWQGVLLIGGAIDRAEAARRGGSRLWRGEEAAREAMALLEGASITVDLAETPVLHRRLLAGPRASVTVSPEMLLHTMDAAFDRARARLARITEAVAQAEALRGRLTGMLGGLAAPALSARLEAALAPDALDRLDALEALAPEVEAARAGHDAASADLARARLLLEAWSKSASGTELAGLAEWLDRLDHTLGLGRVEACRVGLRNWRELADRLGRDVARHAELQARLGALRAKQRARGAGDPHLDALHKAAGAALARRPADLVGAAQGLASYEAALAGRQA